LWPHVLPFQRHKFSLNRSFTTPNIVKNLSRGKTVIVQKLDSNSWTVTVQVFVNERFWLFYRLNWVLLKILNLYPHVLLFQCHKFRLNRSSITPDIVNNLRRSQTVTVQKGDSNSWTVRVQVFVNDDFDSLQSRTGFLSKHRTCSFMSYISNAINFAWIGVL